MKQDRSDYILLSSWAGAAVTSIQHGYDYVMSLYQINRKPAKRKIHAALKRYGYHPHTSSALIQSWIKLRRAFLDRQDTE